MYALYYATALHCWLTKGKESGIFKRDFYKLLVAQFARQRYV